MKPVVCRNCGNSKIAPSNVRCKNYICSKCSHKTLSYKRYEASDLGKAAIKTRSRRAQRKYRNTAHGKMVAAIYKTSELYKINCRQACRRYRQSDKGRAATRSYGKTEVKKAIDRRFRKSEKGKAVFRRYLQSEKGKAKIRRFAKSEKRKIIKRRYDLTEHGASMNLNSQRRRTRKQYWDDYRRGHAFDALPLPDSKIN